MRHGSRRLIVGVMVTGVLLGGCSTADDPGQGDGDEALTRFYDQEADWRTCPADEAPEPAKGEKRSPFECATVTVPLDYREPDGKTIKLALNRLPATDRNDRIGSLLTNPGGPGISGLGYVYESVPQQFTSDLRARYDIVGMDPRGVGKSSPVRCLTQQQVMRQQQEQDDPSELARALARACEKKSGDILPFVGTDNIARDLDVVRAVLGEDKLDYYGTSYGTVLGQFYARQFPDRVGRMVLDSVVNPAVWPGDAAAQAVAYETALGVFVQSCIDKGKCPMGTERVAVLQKIDDLVDRLRSKPLPSGSGNQPVNSQALVQALKDAMHQEESWPRLAKALAAAFDGKGKPLGNYLQATQGGDGGSGVGVGSRIGAGNGAGNGNGNGKRSGNDQDSDATGGNFAPLCLHLPPAQRKQQAAEDAIAEAKEDAPILGDDAMGALGRLACAAWPAPPPFPRRGVP